MSISSEDMPESFSKTDEFLILNGISSSRNPDVIPLSFTYRKRSIARANKKKAKKNSCLLVEFQAKTKTIR